MAEQRAVVEALAQPGEQLDLRVHVLGDRLDDERPVLEALRQVGRDLDAVGREAVLELRAHLRDGALRPLGGRVGSRPQPDLAVAGRACGEPAGDRPRPHDPEPLRPRRDGAHDRTASVA